MFLVRLYIFCWEAFSRLSFYAFFRSCWTQLSYVQVLIYSSLASVLLTHMPVPPCVPLEQFSQLAVFKSWVWIPVQVHLVLGLHFSCQLHICWSLLFCKGCESAFFLYSANNPSLKNRSTYIYLQIEICINTTQLPTYIYYIFIYIIYLYIYL